MDAGNGTVNLPDLGESAFASYGRSGTPLDYHGLLSDADPGDAGYLFGVDPAVLDSNHLVTNTLALDPNLNQPPPRKREVVPKNASRKDTGDEKHKRIFQACARCRDRKAKCDGVQPACSACRIREVECVFAGRRMRGPSKKRLLEDADFTARRRRGAAGITVPEQRVPSYNPQAIEQSATTLGGPFAFPPDYGVTPDSTFHSSRHPTMPPHHVVPHNTLSYDASILDGALCVQMPALLGHTSAGAITSANCARGDQDGEDGRPQVHSRPSSTGTLQFVQFVPPADERRLTTSETSKSIIARDEFNHLVESYITSLARKNREKALMSLAKYSDILRFLEDEAAERNSERIIKRKHGASTEPIGSVEDFVEMTPNSPSPPTPSVGDDFTRSLSPSPKTPLVIPDQLGVPNAVDTDGARAPQNSQFRFWAKKNFALGTVGGVSVVAHNQKLVAVQEQLYDILVYCHEQTNHGGRDKTNALVTKYYSYVPKVFVESFVKACPGCLRKLPDAKRAATLSRFSRPRDDTTGVQLQ